MGIYVDALTADQDAVLACERVRLVRLCAQLTGDAHAAEDLAQETLLVALQQEQAPRDPARRTQWLSGIARWDPRCGCLDVETWHSLTLSLPEARRFWQEHPRLRFRAEREIEVAGSPAVVTGFESLIGSARLEVVSIRDTCEVVSINGVAPRTAERG